MVADRDTEFSSPFDAMLEKDRARLARLYGGALPETGVAAAVEPPPAAPVAPARPVLRASRRREQTEPTSSRPEISGTTDGIPFSIRPRE